MEYPFKRFNNSPAAESFITENEFRKQKIAKNFKRVFSKAATSRVTKVVYNQEHSLCTVEYVAKLYLAT
jgi:hypothetical protein